MSDTATAGKCPVMNRIARRRTMRLISGTGLVCLVALALSCTRPDPLTEDGGQTAEETEDALSTEPSGKDKEAVATCPVVGETHKPTVATGYSNRDWWPNQLNLQMLHQNSHMSNPMGEDFSYAE
jgi:hypothetical protein